MKTQTTEMSRLQPDVFTRMEEHEQVVFCNDPATGLRAIIAIHDTTLGPALGGCRMHPYETTEAALEDVLRLSRGMTQKCAAADVDFGGGKAVIIGDPQKDKSPAMFRAFGRFVASLQGRFYTGTDMGTTMEDFSHALKETECIVGVPEAYGGSGDSSIPTTAGVLNSLRAVNESLFGTTALGGRTYAVQGLGKVGGKVAAHLLDDGADVYAADLSDDALEAMSRYAEGTPGTFHRVDGDAIFAVEADVLVPCAMGGVLNDTTIPQLKVRAVVGAANNQLASREHGSWLQERGILYAPDYIVNGGGLIQVADELYGGSRERVLKKTNAIFTSIAEVISQSRLDQITTVEAADRMCEQRLQERARGNNFFTSAKRPKWNIKG
ncbi:Leu/Phe/Val dehydrogenase [Alkalicoccus urumqiensis]|uniref:Leucine dehydrogenase n=1 Tax=Alkalicoccus urumqiensis TaxID=1548213 RepID=A0A2P6ME26_ALKUR|nr:Glu/Leu/Phe/Val dehydrogenase [Alkalicoccus urumqiensis]PRO64539.1 leucine dehydrogenase [Alkalicoccus urumqiensis]